MNQRTIDLLTEVLEFLEAQYDVVDGSYGEPAPNKAMSLGTQVEHALERLKRSSVPIVADLSLPDVAKLMNQRPGPIQFLPSPVDVEGRDFYELCQQYRCAQPDPIPAWENLKRYITTGELPWPSYEDESSATNEHK